MSDSLAIEVNALRMRFASPHDREVLGGISLLIPDRAFISIVGPSGSGKSTLLQAIAGFANPTGGSIRSFGREVTGPSPERVMLFQSRSVFPWKTALQNVMLGCSQTTSLAEAKAVALHWLDRVGLKGFENYFPSQLSGGMEQRVALCRTFASSARILLLDEALKGLDINAREEMWALLLDLWNGSDKTIVLVTHDVDEAIALSQHIYVIGGTPAQIRNDFPIKRSSAKSGELLFSTYANSVRQQIRDSIMAIDR